MQPYARIVLYALLIVSNHGITVITDDIAKILTERDRICPQYKNVTMATKQMSKKLLTPKITRKIQWSVVMLAGISTSACAAYLIDHILFTENYSAELTHEQKNLRKLSLQQEKLKEKIATTDKADPLLTRYKTEYKTLDDLINKSKLNLLLLKTLKNARLVVASLIFLSGVAISKIASDFSGLATATKK